MVMLPGWEGAFGTMKEDTDRPVNKEFGLTAHLERARELRADGNLDGAVESLQKALRSTGDKTSVYLELADLYRDQRKFDMALAAVRKAIKRSPNDVQVREVLLEMLLELGRFDEAIEESKALLKLSPKSLSARDVLSIAYIQKDMLERALQVTNEMITLDPSSPGNHFKKALLYQQKGDVGNAIHEFSRVLEMEPDAEMAEGAQQAIEALDSFQIRHIVMLAVEDFIFRAKLIRDPESAALERGFFLSLSGMSMLKQIQFDELSEVWSEWKQKFYH